MWLQFERDIIKRYMLSRATTSPGAVWACAAWGLAPVQHTGVKRPAAPTGGNGVPL